MIGWSTVREHKEGANTDGVKGSVMHAYGHDFYTPVAHVFRLSLQGMQLQGSATTRQWSEQLVLVQTISLSGGLHKVC